MANTWGNNGDSDRLFSWASKSMQRVTAAMKLKDTCSLEEKLWPTRQCIRKQRHYFAHKGPSSQSYGFSSNHIPTWELDHKEGWAPKNWCFWTVVLEKTLESPVDCKEIQPVHPKGDQSWVFFGRTDAKAETPILWPPHVKSWLIGKDSDAGRDWGQEEKGMTENEMAGWHHWLDGRESQWTLGVGDGQGGLACCDSWGREEPDTTERLIWSDLIGFAIHQHESTTDVWENELFVVRWGMDERYEPIQIMFNYYLK